MVASGKGNVSVVLPKPTFDINSYSPLGPEVDRTIERILSEEAVMEKSREEDWAIYTGSEGHGLSPSIISSRSTSLAQQSPYFAQPSPIKMKKSRSHKRLAANRTITVVDMTDEIDDHEKYVSPAMSTVAGSPRNESSDGQENRLRASHPKLLKTKKKRRPLDENAQPKVQQDSDLEEEDIIFSSLESSKRDDLIQYIGLHPFLKSADPMKRSVWRRYLDDVRTKATSVGLPKSLTNRLIRYVQKNYLETPDGYDADPSEPDSLVWDEQSTSTVTKAKIDPQSRKRSRQSSEHPKAKKAKTHVASPVIRATPDSAVESVPVPSPVVLNNSGASRRPSRSRKRKGSLVFDNTANNNGASTVDVAPAVGNTPPLDDPSPVVDSPPADDSPIADVPPAMEDAPFVDDTLVVDSARGMDGMTSIAGASPVQDALPLYGISPTAGTFVGDCGHSVDDDIPSGADAFVLSMPFIADVLPVNDVPTVGVNTTVGESAAVGSDPAVEHLSASRKSSSRKNRHVERPSLAPQSESNVCELSAEAGINREMSPPQFKSEVTNDVPVAMSKKEKKRLKKKQKRESQIQQATDLPGISHSILTHQSSKVIRRRSLVSSAPSTDSKRKKGKKEREKYRRRRKAEQQQATARTHENANANVDLHKGKHIHNRTDVAKPAGMSPSRPHTPKEKNRHNNALVPEPARTSPSRPQTPKQQIRQAYNKSQMSPPKSARKSLFAALSPDPAKWDLDF